MRKYTRRGGEGVSCGAKLSEVANLGEKGAGTAAIATLPDGESFASSAGKTLAFCGVGPVRSQHADLETPSAGRVRRLSPVERPAIAADATALAAAGARSLIVAAIALTQGTSAAVSTNTVPPASSAPRPARKPARAAPVRGAIPVSAVVVMPWSLWNTPVCAVDLDQAKRPSALNRTAQEFRSMRSVHPH